MMMTMVMVMIAMIVTGDRYDENNDENSYDDDDDDKSDLKSTTFAIKQLTKLSILTLPLTSNARFCCCSSGTILCFVCNTLNCGAQMICQN